jgi:hypothetical protein
VLGHRVPVQPAQLQLEVTAEPAALVVSLPQLTVRVHYM